MPNIEAHYLEGEGDTLVITFNEMWNHYQPQRFWGENSLRKIGYPAIGVTSDGPHWYPSYETFRALRGPVQTSRSYKHVILYGYSMGAYAALKYSWLFENPIILSFSPQYSIDPADLGGHDTRYSDFFNPVHRVSRIERYDTNGRGYIFYDPDYAVDNAHVTRIDAPQRLVPLHNCGHETIQCVGSSDVLRRLIEAAVRQDDEYVRRLLRHRRRYNKFYAKYLLMRMLATSHDRRTAAVALGLEEAVHKDPETCAMAADALKRVGDFSNAAAFYQHAFATSGEQKYENWKLEALSSLPPPTRDRGPLLSKLAASLASLTKTRAR